VLGPVLGEEHCGWEAVEVEDCGGVGRGEVQLAGGNGGGRKV
jgi:hypothetical protein